MLIAYWVLIGMVAAMLLLGMIPRSRRYFKLEMALASMGATLSTALLVLIAFGVK